MQQEAWPKADVPFDDPIRLAANAPRDRAKT